MQLARPQYICFHPFLLSSRSNQPERAQATDRFRRRAGAHMSTSAWHPVGLVHTPASHWQLKTPRTASPLVLRSPNKLQLRSALARRVRIPFFPGASSITLLPSAAVLALALPLPARPEQPVRGVHERNGSWDSTPPPVPRCPCRCRSVPLEGQHAAAAPSCRAPYYTLDIELQVLLLACWLPFPLLMEARGAPRLPSGRSNGAQAGPGPAAATAAGRGTAPP